MGFAAGIGRQKWPTLRVPFVPTPHDIVKLMLDAANPQPEERLYDLGCGDGRILRKAVREYGCTAVGYEINPNLVSYAVSKARLEGCTPDRLRVLCQDLREADLSGADAVTLYLTPEALIGLRPILETRLRPGVRVVSHNYRIRGWLPESIEETTSQVDGKRHAVFLYRAPFTAEHRKRS
ncbi:MAG: methyltransferase domain-containing protein [Candidatus Bathyarchaeia archaeon]